MEIKYLTENIDNIKDEAERLLLEFVDTTGRYSSVGGRNKPPRNKYKSRVSSGAEDRGRGKEVDVDVPTDTTIFSGDIYRNKSKLKARKFDVFSKARKTPLTGKYGKFEPVFIIGYQLKHPDLTFELWYDALSGKYGLFDKFGGKVGDLEDRLEASIEQLVDIIAKQERGAVSRREEIEQRRRTEKEAEVSIRKSGHTVDDFDFDRFFDSVQYEEDVKYIDKILKENLTTKEFLYRAINDQVEEYHETRLKQREVSKIWSPILGKKLEYPSKFLPGEDFLGRVVQRVRKVFGAEKEATFVIGFTFADKIDMEIWFVRGSSGKNLFYVFDLTSGKMIGKELKSLRSAYQILAKKMAVPEDMFTQADVLKR